MPRASSKPTSSQNTAAPYQVPEAVETHRYGTRGVRYKYSNGKAPHIPPPEPPTERPSLPKSAARKRKDPTPGEGERGGSELEQHNSEPEHEQSEPHNSEPPQASTLDSIDTRMEHSAAVLSPVDENIPHPPAIPEDTITPSLDSSQQSSTALVARDTQGSYHAVRYIRHVLTLTQAGNGIITTASGNPLRTPRRSNRPIGYTTPAVVIFGNSSNWPGFDHDDSQMPSFVPNTSIPFDTNVFSITMSPHPSRQVGVHQSNFSSWALCGNEFANPGSSSGVDEQPYNMGNLDQDVFPSQPTQVATMSTPTFAESAPIFEAPALTPAVTAPASANFNTLYATIMRTIPPILPAAPRAPTPMRPSGREGSMLRDNPASTQLVLASRASSTAPDVGHENEIWGSSVAPSNFRLPRALLPPPPRSHVRQDTYRPNSLRQGNFSYDQVSFIKFMKQRWGLYLVAEDPFPINVLPAQELCLLYAESILGISRAACGITQSTFDYVRKKDSNIRNGFLHGLLKVVEEDYGVTAASKSRVEELILNVNFAHISYDLTTKKITGRYCHPCICKVIKIVLFTRRSRGRPVGVRFIRELMGDTTAESDQDLHDLAANAGAPVAIIALACTLILHALQSIKAGDSSNRKAKTVKPVKFSEQKYGGPYRTILAKMKQYPRLGEVQKAYMEEIMKEYLVAHASTGDESDEELEFDDDMLSDGE
ncbi:hypothetical protein FRC10_012128 [Ceratobasidium sp. 414]|nr:hypothetical protein FRC10_012128 [Ceratobasidium sp. 414]